jgi:hypothetical protein
MENERADANRARAEMNSGRAEADCACAEMPLFIGDSLGIGKREAGIGFFILSLEK